MSRSTTLRAVLALVLPAALLAVLLLAVASPAFAGTPPPSRALTAHPPAEPLAPTAARPPQLLAPAPDVTIPDPKKFGPGALVRPWQQPLRAVLPAGQAAAAGITASQAITVYVNTGLIEGYTTANAAIDVAVSQGGSSVGLSRIRSDGTGWFSIHAMATSGRPLALQAGMVLTVKANSATVATISIPGSVTGTVDPAGNRVTGQLNGFPLPASLQVTAAGVTVPVTTDGSGAFNASFAGAADLAWWDGALVAWKNPGGNWLAWSFYPRGGIVTLPTYDEVDGCSEVGQEVSITVHHGGGDETRTATGQAPTGCWWVSFPAIDPGDTVTAHFGSQTVVQTVSNLAGVADLGADKVAVTAGPANAPVAVGYVQYQGLGISYLWRFGTTNGSGTLTTQFPAGALNRYNWPWLVYADGPKSDTYQPLPIPWAVGYWNANEAFGYAAPGAGMSASLLRGGIPVETVSGQADAGNGYWQIPFANHFGAGDRLRVQGGGLDVSFDLVPLALDFDRAADQLVVTTPPTSRFLARVNFEDFGRYWRSWLSGSGSDTTNVAVGNVLDLRNGVGGYVYRPQGGDGDDLGWTLKYGYAPLIVTHERYDAVYGRLTQPNADFTATAKRGGATTGAASGRTDAWDSMPWTNFTDGAGNGADVRPGDTVEVTWGGEKETMQVLALTGRVDPTTDRVTGTFQANSFVSVYERNTWNTLIVPTDAGGHFVADFTGIADLRGGTEAQVVAWTPEWNRTEITVQAPFVRVDINSDTLAGSFAPGEVVSWTVRDSSDAVKFSGGGTAPEWGWWDQQCDCDVVPGDSITVTTDRGFSAVLHPLPMTARADVEADRVTGKITGAPLPTRVQIWAGSPARDEGHEMIVPVQSDGSFVADFGSEGWDIRPGDDGEAFMWDANGNQVGLHWWTARMDVFYAGDWVWVDGTPGAAVKVTVQGKAVMRATIDNRGRVEGWRDDQVTWTPSRPDIQPGDVVILEVDGYTKRVDPVLDVAITTIDRLADEVAGTISGPGREQLTQVFCETYGPDSGWVRAAYVPASGAYSCNFEARGVDIVNRTNVSARYRDADGDMAVNEVPGQWARANITWDSVGGVYGYGVTMRFEVFAAGGAFKANGSAVGKRDGWVDDVGVGDKTDLVPGDRVHVWTDNGFDAWMTLVGIAGRIDAQANTISGVVTGAPLPGAGWVGLHNLFHDRWTGKDFDIGADGRFTADLNPEDIIVGDDAEVWYRDANGNAPGAWFATLRAEVNTGGDWVVLYTGANTPFTVTVRSAANQVKARLTGLTDNSGNMRGWEEGWSQKWTPSQPDIRPGDKVEITAYGYTKEMNPVADIRWQADVTTERITGQIFAPGQTEPVPAWCSVWVDNGPPSVPAQPNRVDPNGGTFTCDFRQVGWDLKPGQYAAVGFVNANGDTNYHSADVEGVKTFLPLLKR